MLFDYRFTTPSENYKLMSQTLIPRPIAWIVTQYDEVTNIAPFSYFTGLSSKPPTLIVSIGHKSDGSPKDTLLNIRKTKKCTICMVLPEHLQQMHFSSKELSHAQSEADEFGISLKNIVEGFPPAVEDSPSIFFCELYREIEMEESKTVPLILEIKKEFVDDRYILDPKELIIEYKPLARVGKSYRLLGKSLDTPELP